MGWHQLKQTENIKTSRAPIGELAFIKKSTKYLITPIGIIAISIYYLLNASVWLLAWWKYKTEKNYLILWKTAKSTK